MYESRFLIDTLHEMGFCCSYSTISTYERSAAFHQGIDLVGYDESKSVQFIADNVDHNICTLDGHGTFHGMGIMATLTPSSPQLCKQRVLKKHITTDELTNIGRIQIYPYFKAQADVPSLMYKSLPAMRIQDDTHCLDELWKISLSARAPRPSWRALMQMIYRGEYPGQASFVFCPMIDMSPSDPTCIFSTLHFVCAQAKKYQFTPILTFDQPLWFKALEIIHNEPANSILKDVVLRLGAFHMEMSFLGSIGN